MSFELIIHLVIDAVVTFSILYFLLKHIRTTEKFYDESRVEWERQQDTDKKLEQKLNDYLSRSGLENKIKISKEIDQTSKVCKENQNLLTHYLANMSKPHNN